jgi:ParB-like chromosome segregation protein Spo0J
MRVAGFFLAAAASGTFPLCAAVLFCLENHPMSQNVPKIREIPLDQIDRSRNYRIPMPGDAEKLESLKGSIKDCGQLQPVRVYERGENQKDKKHQEPYILGFGNRRCKALEMLGRTTVQAIVFPPASDAQIAQAKAVENLHRQDITPLEEVQAVADVLEAIKADTTFTGDPYEEAAARLACLPNWVKDRDYLHRLTKPVQRFALRANLPAGHLRELAKVGDPAEQIRLACEMAGAPPHVFPADSKDGRLEEWQRQQQEQYFAELADGKVQRWPLSRLKEQIAKAQLSLRTIPWIFDQPVEFGSAKFRKCAGCPHNSETDRTLFGIDEDATNPNGYCLHSACFNGKHEAVEAAKEQVVKKISQKDDQSPGAIRKLAPQWLKETSVVGHVKRQLEKAARPPTPSTKARGSDSPRELTEHEKALQKYADKLAAWQKKAWATVMEAINTNPAHRVSWCVLLGVPAMWDHPRVTVPIVQVYREPQTQEPEVPPVAAELQTAIMTAFDGTRAGWIEVLKGHEQIHPDSRNGFGVPHPCVLERLADAIKVKLPPTPQWKTKVAQLTPAVELSSPPPTDKAS